MSMNTHTKSALTPAAALIASIALFATGSLHAASKSADNAPLANITRAVDTKGETEGNIYTVKSGDYLGAIAMAHHTTVAAIIELNNLTTPDRILEGTKLLMPRPGTRPPRAQKKPSFVTIEIPKGVTLSRVANVYGVSIKKILAANRQITNPDNIRSGQKLTIPGVSTVVELVPPPPCYAPEVEFLRVRTNETKKIALTFCNGKPNPDGVAALSEMSGPARMEKIPFPLHPRLAILLQKVANKFPGKRLEIISGQRVRKSDKHESYHNKGQAIDFRVAGVSNKTLVNYVRTFKNSGAGYYPNSVFIHMDTRERSAFWIDYSRPGERPIYAKAGLSKKALAAIRAKRAAAKANASVGHEANQTSDNDMALTPTGSIPTHNENNRVAEAASPLPAAIDQAVKKAEEAARNTLDATQASPATAQTDTPSADQA